MFFEAIYCINLDSRPDRWEECTAEFDRVGINVKRLAGVEGNFNRSQANALKQAAKHESSLILEDDVEFRDMTHLDEALKALPADWDVVFLGATLNSKHKEKVHPNLYVYKDGWATQAVGYSRKMANYIAEKFNPDGGVIFDEWLRFNILPFFKCYIVSPMVCYQRPSFSNLRGRFVDYTAGFEQSEKLFV